MLKRIRKSKCRWLLLAALLGGCGRPTPPEPTGDQVPVNASLWDYHGYDIFPARTD